MLDYKKLDPLTASDEIFAYSLGAQLFPRPHFELFASWKRELTVYNNFQSDLYWLVLHYYL